jgi:hypothetical protein
MTTRQTRSQRVIDRGPNRPLQLEETVLVTSEVVVDTDDGDSPFGWRELDPPPPANRATRRAAARATRRKK